MILLEAKAHVLRRLSLFTLLMIVLPLPHLDIMGKFFLTCAREYDSAYVLDTGCRYEIDHIHIEMVHGLMCACAVNNNIIAMRRCTLNWQNAVL